MTARGSNQSGHPFRTGVTTVTTENISQRPRGDVEVLARRAARPAGMRRQRSRLLAEIARWRNNLLDSEVAVDDARNALQVAIRDRDRTADHLAHLIDWAESTQPTTADELAHAS